VSASAGCEDAKCSVCRLPGEARVKITVAAQRRKSRQPRGKSPRAKGERNSTSAIGQKSPVVVCVAPRDPDTRAARGTRPCGSRIAMTIELKSARSTPARRRGGRWRDMTKLLPHHAREPQRGTGKSRCRSRCLTRRELIAASYRFGDEDAPLQCRAHSRSSIGASRIPRALRAPQDAECGAAAAVFRGGRLMVRWILSGFLRG